MNRDGHVMGVYRGPLVGEFSFIESPFTGRASGTGENAPPRGEGALMNASERRACAQLFARGLFVKFRAVSVHERR